MTDWAPLWLTLRLAATTTGVLLLIGIPFAWWLATTRTRFKPAIEALTALPLVLPATVLGFYFLILFNPQSPLGGAWVAWTGGTLTFSFAGLVAACTVSSFPFMVQPLQAAFEGVGRPMMEAAATLRARPLDAFVTVALPLATRGVLTGSVLSFAHTVGEFGIVLLVGGNIPGQTRTVSIAVYESVEALRYGDAHRLSAILLAFTFLVLLAVYLLNRRVARHGA